jgi:hypothetical protein
MGKRDTGTKFEKKDRNFYGTIDPVAAKVILPYLDGLTAAEPCYGDGDLVKNLIELGYDRFVFTSDIFSGSRASLIKDGKDLTETDLQYSSCIVTNPPFDWSMLKPLMDCWIPLIPTWLLLPADVIHNKRMAPYMDYCDTILSIGRMYWEENKVKGVDNFVWLHFVPEAGATTVFKART